MDLLHLSDSRSQETWRLFALGGALLLYGLLSAPAPPAIRGVEAAIAVLLALAVGLREPWRVATGRTLAGVPSWQGAGTAALLWLGWAPLLRGLWMGWDAGDIARDVVPLLFLFLPLVLVPALRRAGPRAVEALAAALMLAGLLFALRWWRQAGWGFGALGVRAMGDGSLYFLNAPAVLFAAIGLPAAALALAVRGGAVRWAAALALAAAGALCLGALAGAVHRMALALAAPALLLVALGHRNRSPRLVAAVLLAAALAAVALDGVILGALSQVAEKNRLAGGNARIEEAVAALEQVGRSLPSLLFGDGWGALIANPAVGGWRVSYTHTLVTYALLKGGLCGLLALVAWLGGLLPSVRALARSNPALACACLPPLLVSLGLHTSFKYLDTGLLLTLLVLAAERGATAAPKLPLSAASA